MNNYPEIQELLEQRADWYARLKLLAYDGTPEIKKNQSGRLLIDKVIDKALNLRLSKGDLNESGLSVKEFSVIRNSMAELMKEDMF